MSLYLITGPCGAGKSTVAHELNRRGLSAVDGDHVPGLVEWFSVATNRPVDYPSGATSPEWLAGHKHRWNRRIIENLARSAMHKRIFLCGISSNQEWLYDQFDKVFLLKTESDTLDQRMRDRDNGNDFGKLAVEREYVLSWKPRFEERNIDLGAIPVNASLPLNIVVGSILGRIIYEEHSVQPSHGNSAA